MERNPEIRQMLNNPEVLRQVTNLSYFSSFDASEDHIVVIIVAAFLVKF